MTGYTAPASLPFTLAHIPAPGTADPDGPGPDGQLRICEGTTVCGRDMTPAELWVPVVLRDGDRVCPACANPQAATAEQGALL